MTTIKNTPDTASKKPTVPSKRNSRHDLATKERFIEHRARGMSLAKIAKAMKIGKTTLVEWNKEFQGEIATLKAIELEALQEEYFIAKQEKIKLFGEKIKTILSELDKRDLSDISTDKLFDILAKYHAILEGEAITPIFKTECELNNDKMTLMTLMKLSSTKEA